jgi:hypothetical protein
VALTISLMVLATQKSLADGLVQPTLGASAQPQHTVHLLPGAAFKAPYEGYFISVPVAEASLVDKKDLTTCQSDRNDLRIQVTGLAKAPMWYETTLFKGTVGFVVGLFFYKYVINGGH